MKFCLKDIIAFRDLVKSGKIAQAKAEAQAMLDTIRVSGPLKEEKPVPVDPKPPIKV